MFMNKFSLNRRIARCAALITAAAAVPGIFAGCGGKSPSDGEPLSIEIWHYYNGSLQNSFDKMIENFNNTVGAENNITVSAHSQGSIADLEAAVLNSAQKQVGSSELPDI